MENKTLTSAFLISRFTQQANNKIFGVNQRLAPLNKMYGQYFASGLSCYDHRTKNNNLILTRGYNAFTRLSTPWGNLTVYSDVYATDMTRENDEVKEKCGLLQITPEYRTEWSDYGSQFLVTRFKHEDTDYHAEQAVISRVRTSKFHTMGKLDCRDPDNKQTCEDMFEFQNSFYHQRGEETAKTLQGYHDTNTMWLQHLSFWFKRGLITDNIGLSDEVRKRFDNVEAVFKTLFSYNLVSDIKFTADNK